MRKTMFVHSEKIAYLSQKLTTLNTPSTNQVKSNFTYYDSWGNLALFYKGAGHYVLGQIEFGQEKEKLAAMDQNFVATIEQIE